jgi:hypothetical protein
MFLIPPLSLLSSLLCSTLLAIRCFGYVALSLSLSLLLLPPLGGRKEG